MSVTNITQPSFSSGIISTELFSRIDFNKVSSGLKQCKNWVIRPAGGALFRAGTKYIAETKFPLKKVSLIPFVFNRKDGLCLEFGEKYIRFYKDGEQVKKNGQPYEITTSYTAFEVSEIKYTQQKNDIYLAHRNHPPMLLHRNTDNDWTLRELKFNPDVPFVIALNIESLPAKDTGKIVKKDDWQYAVSVVDGDNEEGLPVYSAKIENDIDLLNQNIKVTFKRPTKHDNIKHFNIYRVKGGRFFLCYIIKYEDKETFSFTDISYSLDERVSPKKTFSEFSRGNYPAAIGFWNQRLVLANSTEKPNTFWMSRVGEPEDFTTSELKLDDEAIELTFNSGKSDAVTDIVAMDDLIVFTEGRIWRVSGTSLKDMRARIESYTGSSGLRPYVTKKSILYVDSSQNTVSNFVYSYELNGYSGQNLDLLTRDLMDGYIIDDLSYRDTPYGVLYSVRNDGTLLGLTYLREENIYAWHEHTTPQGRFKNICSIDGDKVDSVYCVVERFGKTYVEQFASYINKTQDIDDSWHLDCATREVSNTIEWENVTENINKINYMAYRLNEPTEWFCVETFYGSPTAGFLGTGNYYYHHEGSGEYWYAKDNKPTAKTKADLTKVDGGIGPNWGAGRYNFHETIPNEIYITEKSAGTKAYTKDIDNFVEVGTTDNYSETLLNYKRYDFVRDSSKDEFIDNSTKETSYLFTVGFPKVGDNAYTDIFHSVAYIIDEVTKNTITVSGKVYNKKSSTIDSITEVTGLERFNGKKVCLLADTNVYRDILVENGKITLPYPSNVVLVGLNYEGILEPIPQELKYSSGNSTVGINRKINDVVLSYYKTRGLWYGKDVNDLYEIKPYTQKTFSENIPLESGKQILKVSDGFSLESSLVIVQKGPFPAMVQSITLGSTYDGKN